MFYVAWKRGLPRKFARFVLFRLIKKRSFNLLCVLELFLNEFVDLILVQREKYEKILNVYWLMERFVCPECTLYSWLEAL